MPIRKSSVSGGSTPSGTTEDRPANPSIGDTFFNGTLGVQEIYTESGWLPATGANDFNVVLSNEDTSVTLDKEYFSGAYTISSALADSSFDIYLFDTQGNSAGYTKSPSINATNNFNKIVVLGGQAGDLLSFSYKTTFTTASITDEVTTGPVIKSISVADLPNIDDTTVITGINFAEDVQVTFTGTDEVTLSAKSIVRSSATSLVVTRPDNLVEDYSPYTITVTNPGIISPTGTNGHISTNAITAGGDPVWVTASSFAKVTSGGAYSTTLQATDPEGGTITYSLAAGSLPPGFSLNSSTGELSGTMSGGGFYSFTIAAQDQGGNITNRAFTLPVEIATSLAWETYGSGVEVSEPTPASYSVFNLSGTTTGWTKGAITTTYFEAPFTVKMQKNVSTNSDSSYTMGGLIPVSSIDTAKASNVSYNYGYMHYPVTPTSYNWYEKGNNGSLGSFTSGDTVYLTVESDGTVKYWKNGNLVRTTSTPLVPLALQIANYAQNSTYGGFYNIQHFEGLIWNGSALV